MLLRCCMRRRRGGADDAAGNYPTNSSRVIARALRGASCVGGLVRQSQPASASIGRGGARGSGRSFTNDEVIRRTQAVGCLFPPGEQPLMPLGLAKRAEAVLLRGTTRNGSKAPSYRGSDIVFYQRVASARYPGTPNPAPLRRSARPLGLIATLPIAMHGLWVKCFTSLSPMFSRACLVLSGQSQGSPSGAFAPGRSEWIAAWQSRRWRLVSSF